MAAAFLSSGDAASLSAIMEAAAGKAAAAAGESSAAKKEPPVDVCAPQVFLLTGGGSGVGKAHFRNSEAVYVERHPKKALNWARVRITRLAPTHLVHMPRSRAS